MEIAPELSNLTANSVSIQLHSHLLYMLPLTPGADLACQHVESLGRGVCGHRAVRSQLSRIADSSISCNKD